MRDINVLIGGNGSGKSNFLSVLEMLYVSTMNWDDYFKLKGGAKTFLHYGPKITQEINFRYIFNYSKYYFTLVDTLPDDLTHKTFEYVKIDTNGKEELIFNKDTYKRQKAYEGWGEVYVFAGGRVFHFDDTSETSGIRRYSNINDSAVLHHDGSNLASILYKISLNRKDEYFQIVETVRLAAPFFGDFLLEPEGERKDNIIIKWKEGNSENIFQAHQLPDGLLRFIALTTVLLFESKFRRLIVIDEPELGLHPFAISLLAGMIRQASHHSQIIIATQSETVVNQFEAKDIIVVNRRDGVSEYERLDENALKGWLKRYSLGELWGKNVIGGRP